MEFIIRNQVYTQEQIRKLNLAEWAASNIVNMPKSLFKYFSNTVDEETGRNYSLEALENNTVYLQSPNNFDDIYDCSIVFDEYEYAFARLRYYARHCGFDIKETDYWKYIYVLAQNIYEDVIKFQTEGIQLGDALKRVFRVCGDGTFKDGTHSMFVLNMCRAFNNNAN